MTMVRVDPALHQRLRSLSSSEQRSISQVIEEAIDRYETEKFWSAVHDGFARLHADPEAWADYQDEIALWETASLDGLENEEPYDSDPDKSR